MRRTLLLAAALVVLLQLAAAPTSAAAGTRRQADAAPSGRITYLGTTATAAPSGVGRCETYVASNRAGDHFAWVDVCVQHLPGGYRSWSRARDCQKGLGFAVQCNYEWKNIDFYYKPPGGAEQRYDTRYFHFTNLRDKEVAGHWVACPGSVKKGYSKIGVGNGTSGFSVRWLDTNEVAGPFYMVSNTTYDSVPNC
ncbi:MAG TPA: hypothetical protein VFC13_24440 [Actinomycetes bacterium]|jgi:hypothetical protein|nr:hypothetical protein [Actinomycetes bacterium]